MSKLIRITNFAEYESFRSSHKRGVILYGAAWCQGCKDIEPLYTRIANRYYKRIAMAYADIDICKLDFSKVPVLVSYYKGVQLKSIVGVNRERLKNFIKDTVEHNSTCVSKKAESINKEVSSKKKEVSARKKENTTMRREVLTRNKEISTRNRKAPSRRKDIINRKREMPERKTDKVEKKTDRFTEKDKTINKYIITSEDSSDNGCENKSSKEHSKKNHIPGYIEEY